MMGSATGSDVVADALLKAWPKAVPTATRFAKLAGCTPDDLLQEAFLVALEDPSRVNLEYPENSFRVIVRYVGHRAAAKHRLRQRGIDSSRLGAQVRGVESLAEDVSVSVANEEVAALVKEELRSLPRSQQAVIENQLEGEALSELAKSTGKSEKGLWKERTRAHERLRDSGKLKKIVENLTFFPVWADWRSNPKSGLTLAASLAVVAGLTLATTWMALSIQEQSRVPLQHWIASSGDFNWQPVQVSGALIERSIRDGHSAMVDGPNDIRPVSLRETSIEDLQIIESPLGSSHGDEVVETSRSSVPALIPDVGGGPLSHYGPWRQTRHFSDGTLFIEWYEVNGLKHGRQTTFRPDGTRAQEIEFRNGVLFGWAFEFHANGNDISRMMFVDDDGSLQVLSE